MNTHRFFVEKLRFHLTDKKKLVFVGWFFDGSTRDHTLSAHLDGEDLPLALQINKGAEVRQKYIRCVNEISEEVVGIITLPEDWKRHRQLVITAAHQGNVTNTCKVSAKKLGRLEQDRDRLGDGGVSGHADVSQRGRDAVSAGADALSQT